MRYLVLFLVFFVCQVCAVERSLFDNPDITTEYSPLLQEKNARNDSLLPALDGDRAFAELIRKIPNLWSLEQLGKKEKVLTHLKAKIIYIDGIREEPFCDLDKSSASSAGEWFLNIGVDFVSGGSNIVGIHVQQCLNMVRDELGYVIQKGNKVVTVPPKKVLEKIKESEIPSILDVDLQTKLLKAHESVALDGKCPKDIEAYIILMDVWNQVKDTPMDIVVLNDDLNRKRNGGKSVQSCAFSREWNKRYQEQVSFECNIDERFCVYRQSDEGVSKWQYVFDQNRFEYINKKFLFWNRSPKSIHKGGTMMDLRIIRLSTNLYMEGYMNEKLEPVALGLFIIPDGHEDQYYEDEEYESENENEILE